MTSKSTSAIAFHDRFQKADSYSQKSILVILSGAIVYSLSRLAVQKPSAGWTFGYFLLVVLAKSFLDFVFRSKHPDIAAIQDTMGKERPIPKNAIVVTDTFMVNPKAIAFVKTAGIHEWPEPADIICAIAAEWIYDKSSRNSQRVIMYLHGGVYLFGKAEQYRPNNHKLSKMTGSLVFAPQNPFPCAVIDAVSAYMFLLERFEPHNIAFMGNSAGGGLSMATLLAIRKMNLPMPAGAYLQSPWLDLTGSFPSTRDPDSLDYISEEIFMDGRLVDRLHYYAANVDLKNPLVSPFWEPNLSGLPPILIQCGSAERLHDEIVGFAKVYDQGSHSGIHLEIYDSHVHIFQEFTMFSAAKKAIQRAGVFLKEHVFKENEDKSYVATVYDFNGDKMNKL